MHNIENIPQAIFREGDIMKLSTLNASYLFLVA